MDELFNMLSASARINKSKRKKAPAAAATPAPPPPPSAPEDDDIIGSDDEYVHSDSDSYSSDEGGNSGQKRGKSGLKSRDRTNKRDTSAAKLAHIHREEVSAFRRRMGIRLSDNNRHDASVPDPLSSFDELNKSDATPPCVSWLSSDSSVKREYTQILNAMLRNIEAGRWTEPTPIQMQSIPALLSRRDVMGCAPTGSGKSGAFVIPSLILSSLSAESFYGVSADESNNNETKKKKNSKKKKRQSKGGKGDQADNSSNDTNIDQTGQIRSLLLAPSRELASQLHREVERLGVGKPGGLRTALLSKNNAALISSNKAGGKRGLDVLVATPLRLVECIERGLKLASVRLVVLDEADRLLDCTDGILPAHAKGGDDSDSDDDDEQQQKQSGSSHAKSFVEQIDSILASCPTTAIRGLFSATLGPAVRHLSESVLRNPVDVGVGRPAGAHAQSTSAGASTSPAANSDIDQSLMFVGKEEGKLLAIRQIVQKGFRPPAIIFLQSKERAQALFGELLYDGVNVDVIHAGRSQAARDAAVAKFRKGETWILICTDLVARGVDFKAVNMVINYDLPTSGVTYVHRIGRTGRAGRKGTAITLFTEADFDSIRPIANVMKLSGCKVPDWILALKKAGRHGGTKERLRKEKNVPKRKKIDTTAGYDKEMKRRKKQSIDNSRKQQRKD